MLSCFALWFLVINKIIAEKIAIIKMKRQAFIIKKLCSWFRKLYIKKARTSRAIKKVKLVYKPSSVLDDHLSRRIVANPLMRFWERTSSSIAPHLAPRRVYSHSVSPHCGVCSCHAFPPLPFAFASWRFISVALFRRSPWIDVINYACSLVLGLSSPIFGAIIWLTLRYYFITLYGHCQGWV